MSGVSCRHRAGINAGGTMIAGVGPVARELRQDGRYDADPAIEFACVPRAGTALTRKNTIPSVPPPEG